MARDLYLYRATARLQAGYLDDAMADCQVLAQNYEMDADAWFLTGKVALEMDGYDEAASDFEQAYGEDSSYDRAIQIYETYLDKDMERMEPGIWRLFCLQRQREQRIFAAGEESITIWEIIPMPRKS